MTALGEAGLLALQRLSAVPRGVERCDERLLEKLLRRVLNDLEDFSLSLTAGSLGKWYPGVAGWLPDLMAEGDGGRFLAGLEVKTRANINWAYYGTEVWQSQLDRYAWRAKDVGGGQAPLYLLVDATNKKRVLDELAADGEARITSAGRWSVLTLHELLERAPQLPAVAHPVPPGAAAQLLDSLLAEP